MSRARDLANVADDVSTGTVVTTASPSLGRRNLIINGAMQVAQRGTSSTNSGYGSVDRFNFGIAGGTATHSQESLTSGNPFDLGFRNFVRLTNTDVITDAATHYRTMVQPIEAQNLACSGWNYTSSSSTITLSFWVRSSVAQTYYGYVRIFDAAYLQSFSFELAADTWTKVTKTITGASGIQINNDNGYGMQVLFAPYWGTNFTSSGATLDQWAAFNGNARVPDMDSTWADTDEATFDLTGVQLEVGSVATPFEHRSFGEELALCQRYFYRSQGTGAYTAHGMGANFDGDSSDVFIHYPVEMRAIPNVTFSGTVSIHRGAGTNANISNMGDAGGSKTTSFIRCDHSSILATGDAVYCINNNDASGEISFNAEL